MLAWKAHKGLVVSQQAECSGAHHRFWSNAIAVARHERPHALRRDDLARTCGIECNRRNPALSSFDIWRHPVAHTSPPERLPRLLFA